MASAALAHSRRFAVRASALLEWRFATPALVLARKRCPACGWMTPVVARSVKTCRKLG